MEKIIRFVRGGDTAEILNIYAEYIEETAITFEYTVPTVAEFDSRIREITEFYPYLVYLYGGKIVGYAYAHRHMERAAYQWNAELSVYVESAYLRFGIGKALYTAIIEILGLQNIRNIYGLVTLPNINSEKLHECFGFEKLGVYKKTGYKFGKWYDVALFGKSISTHESDPKLPISIKQINKDYITERIARNIW